MSKFNYHFQLKLDLSLESKCVFVKCSGGKYYLDQKIWNQLRKTKLIFLAAAIVIAVTLVLLNVL